jgi:hypothetical protein
MNLKHKITWFLGIYLVSVGGFILVNTIIELFVHRLIH